MEIAVDEDILSSSLLANTHTPSKKANAGSLVMSGGKLLPSRVGEDRCAAVSFRPRARAALACTAEFPLLRNELARLWTP